MKAEYDGKRLTVEVGPGKRQAALDLVAAHFRETQNTRRLFIITATGLAVVAAVLVVFAPQGREILSRFIGAVLTLLALGAAGFSKFYLKIPFLELTAGEERIPEED